MSHRSRIPEGDYPVKTQQNPFAKVHQHGAGARRGEIPPEQSARCQGIGRSRGGLTTKLMALVDKRGRLVRFTVRPGNVNEGHELPALLDSLAVEELIADKAFDSDRIRLMLAALGAVSTIPPEGKPHCEAVVRCGELPDPSPCGELLCGHQAVQRDGNSVLQAGGQLCRLRGP